MSHPLYTNRLIHEKSPYLLQHAHNPVDWYPWSEEAFKIAKEQDKPIFLSVGYATCHWCHVMESESFQSIEVAQLMNDTFINIKVDREELPEVDSLYMEFAQAMMSGGAGWPLNLVLTPELLPFFAATYLPADATRGFLGMKQLVLRIRQIWEDVDERDNVVSQAGKIVDVFANNQHLQGQDLPEKEKISEGADLLFKTADPVYGGTKGAPKFPIGFQICFLLRQVRTSADSRALFYVERTLEMMHRGGIYDHLGGGFSRYSIDEKWIIPHFEKMLYDNAILTRAFLETWEYTRNRAYREIADQILTYVERDMRHPQGGFYSAEDADSEGHEGRFYTWSLDELHMILGQEAPLFCEYYSVAPHGNFEGRSVLHMKQSLEEFASHHRMDPILFKQALDEMRAKLWAVREEREHPPKDDKILTAWNGLMIYAFAEAGRVLNHSHYLDVAQTAAEFIHENLWVDGTLLRRWREGEARFDGCLDDHAFLIQGLLSLFEADRGSRWLEFALTLAHTLQTEFKAETGAYHLTNGKDPNIILRRTEFYDGAEPSGNAVHAENLLRLFQITGAQNYLEEALDILKAAKEHIDLYPPGACYHLMALQRYYDQNAPTITISLNEQEELKDEISKMLGGHFIPHKVVIWRREKDEELRDLVPACRTQPPVEGKTTLYICYKDRCLEPITDVSKMWDAINAL
ncbi:MAG: hypothetical protein S4CHLAM123_07550 [Chlamydiales bacterium]|nr:hypothetical protein [Chlamydiales bacterium]